MSENEAFWATVNWKSKNSSFKRIKELTFGRGAASADNFLKEAMLYAPTFAETAKPKKLTIKVNEQTIY